ncbi:MAG: CCA tRNA nucleotidyltransferase [Candidatus Woesearchaeota archaeon]
MKEILKKIKPGTEERKKFESVTKLFLKKLNSTLKDAAGIIGGSGAKDTWLSGNHDVDIFVQFNYEKFSSKSEQLSDLLEKALKKTFPSSKIERLHGSRDYFQLRFEEIDFEVIPILKVKKAADAKNITDLSPLHSIWINVHTGKLKDDIRLTKQFCKSNRVYGAESYIGGFSGYVLEILVAYYGSFQKLLQATQKWKEKEVIDPENYYPKKDALFHLNSSKQQSPLILIDPTDKNRNVAAALSLEKFLEFKRVTKEYLTKPSERFFQKEVIIKEHLEQESQKNKLKLVFLDVQPLLGKEDVVGAQLVKGFEFIKKELQKFGVRKSAWEWDKKQKAVFYFMLEKERLPDFEVRMGPPLTLKEHVAHFKKEHKNTFEEKGKVYAKIKVEHPWLKDFLENLVKEKYLKEKVKKII